MEYLSHSEAETEALVARLAASPNHEDSWVDLVGYAACGAELACRGGEV